MKLRPLNYFLISFILLRLIPFCLVAQEEELIWIEGRLFDIIGTDNRSVSFANTLSEHVAETCTSYLEAGSHDFSQRIVVTLRPKERVKFEKNYRLQVNSRGQVSLDFRWDQSLDFEMVCRAFTEAYILHYVRYNYGLDASKHIRSWAVSTLVSRNYLSLRPAQKTTYSNKVRESEAPKVETLLSLYWKEKSEEKLHSYYGYMMFQILRQNGLKRSQVSNLLDQAVAGIDVTTQIAGIFVPEDEGQPNTRLEEWWQGQVRGYLAQEHEFCDSLATSQSWIEKVASFDSYRMAGGKLKSLMELWTYRNDEGLRLILGARHEIIRLRIERVNPAYFNAALSLGALYETVLEAESKHEFIRAAAVYLNDWDDTRRLHARAIELLSVQD